MPSSAVQIRNVCGGFLPVYIAFMYKRAKSKLAARIAIFRLTRAVDGVMFGFLLSYLFWGGFLLQCGDIESNPGPNPPPAKDNMKQTRFPSFGSPQRVRLDTASNPDTSTVPSRSGPSISDVMASIGAMRSEMGTLRSEMGSQFDDIRKEFHDLRADYAVLQSEVKDLKKDVTKLMIVNQDLQRENKDLFAKMTDYEAKLDDLEGRSKRNNLIFYGFPRRDGETSDDCEGLLRDLFVDKLDLTEDIELDRVHRLSSKPDSPIIARCAFYKQKVKILSQKRKLKGTQVFVGEDFSRRVRDLRKRLTPHLKKAREDGKRAVMVFNYLLIDSKKYAVNDGDQLIEMK